MEESTLEQKKLRRKGQWSKTRDKAAQRNSYTLAPGAASSVTSLSEMSARCRDRKGSGDWGAGRRGVWSEVEPVSGREKVSSLSVKMFVIFVSQTPNQ